MSLFVAHQGFWDTFLALHTKGLATLDYTGQVRHLMPIDPKWRGGGKIIYSFLKRPARIVTERLTKPVD